MLGRFTFATKSAFLAIARAITKFEIAFPRAASISTARSKRAPEGTSGIDSLTRIRGSARVTNAKGSSAPDKRMTIL